MMLDDCTRILNEARELGVTRLAFSGGEPLTWRGIEAAADHAVRLGMEVSIYTSGNVDAPERLFRSLKILGCRRFVLSMFGASPITHDRITRISGSFRMTLEAIAALRRLDTEAQVHFVPFVDNFQELGELCRLCRENGVSQISVLRFVPQGRGALFRRHGLQQLHNLKLKRSIEQLRRDGFVIRTGSPYNFLLVNKQPECSSGFDRLIVGPGLDIYPCDAFKQLRAEDVGGTSDYSRLDQFSLRDCWQKSPFLRKVRGYLTTPFGQPCATCTVLNQCLSGCLAQKVIAHGDFDKRPDPACLRGKG